MKNLIYKLRQSNSKKKLLKRMQLKPLEFSDCLSDSPFFRQSLHQHEIALEQTSKKIKEVEQNCRKILSYTNKLSQAQKQLADSLNDFKVGMIGTMSEDDLVLANYTKQLANVIILVEDQRAKTVQEMEKLYLSPLQSLVERINKVRDERHKYSKESTKFYQTLDRNLNLKVTNARKNDFHEPDSQLASQQEKFCRESLNYVSQIQTVQERVRIEFLQTISSFLYQWLLFYHMANAIHQDFRTTYNEINDKIEKAKVNCEVQKTETDELQKKILANFMRNTVFQKEAPGANPERKISENVGIVKQGYLFLHEKTLLPRPGAIGRDVLTRNNWTKYYCVYSRETKIFTLIPATNTVKTDIKGGWIGQTISFKKLDCSRRLPDSIDKRFCFDVIPIPEPEIKSEVFTFQALSEIDCNQWLESMDGREPVYGANSGASTSSFTNLDENGFAFIRTCIDLIEEKGIKEQGIYRNCGVQSKCQKLMQIALEPRKCEKLNISDPEWEIKTISSAIKTFLRNLPEPLMTFDLHQNFINAAKMHNAIQRVQHIHYWVYKLPGSQKAMLEMIIRHLRRVADHSSENLMSVGNLAVCFGPTLLRPREETVAAVLDIKFCNVVVEALIENCELIFGNAPQKIEPCPPKPAKNNGSAGNGNASIGDGQNNPFMPTMIDESFSSKSSDELNSSLSEINIMDSTEFNKHLPSMDDSYPSYSTLSSLQSNTKSTFSTRPTISGSTHNFPIAAVRQTQQQQQPQIGKQIESRSDLCLSESTTPHSELIKGAGKRRGRGPSDVDSPASSSSSIDRSIISRGKASCSQYAPLYNPMPSESAYNYVTMRIPPNYSAAHKNTEPMLNRIPPAYSSFINPNSPLHPPRRVRTLYPCVAGHETELSFEAGQIITNVYESKEEGWLVGTLNGKTGLIPANYVSFVDNF